MPADAIARTAPVFARVAPVFSKAQESKGFGAFLGFVCGTRAVAGG